MSDIAIEPSAFAPRPGSDYAIQGHIFFNTGLPAGSIKVRAYNRHFGGAADLLGETQARADGYYSIIYHPQGPVNLEIRIVNAQGNENTVSDPRFGAGPSEQMNLVVSQSAQPPGSEYQRIANEVGKLSGGFDRLAAARESQDRQDFTLLAAASNWDARVIAIGSSAAAGARETGIPTEALYAILRAGLPSDAQQLAAVGPSGVQLALQTATAAGIVQLNQDQIKTAVAAYRRFATGVLKTSRPERAVSTYADLLASSTLSPTERDNFAQAYFETPSGGTDLWKAAAQRGVPSAAISSLQLQGKLAALTGNNAPLVQSVQHELEKGLTDLVAKDFYLADTWRTRLKSIASSTGQDLANLIPNRYTGDSTARLEAYAADLARRVRATYPTEVVTRMVGKNELAIGAGASEQVGLARFLANAAPLKFTLGATPVSTFLTTHKDAAFAGIAAGDIPAVTKNIKTLQRLYQITPSNEALKATADLGFRSAREIADIPHDVFMQRFAAHYPGIDEAELVYRKAHQVSSVTLSFFAAAKQMQTSAPIFGISPPPDAATESRNNLLKHYPTMASLFGSLDYCQCSDCTSVLSPAAYFVDILQFIDPDDAAWKGFLAEWKTTHDNAPYPFHNQTDFNAFKADWAAKHPGDPLPDTQKTPFTVLSERRPDLQNLPLTCENANTAMPYIDIVNEILEAYVAKGALTEDDVYDTGQATTVELLAEPQNITVAAYSKLGAKYPITLPFDLWLETVRRFFQYFNVEFWQVLEMFRPSDDLYPPAVAPKPYYRADIFAEQLGLSPAEYKLFTDDAGLASWHELYGYASEAAALAALFSAPVLARSLSVTYQDLADLVLTNFLNARLQALVILNKMGVDVATVFQYKKHPKYTPLTPDENAAFEAILAKFTADYPGFDAKSWLDTAWTSGDFNNVLVLASPVSNCDFSQTTLQYADGTQADAIVFLKLNLFVRLWRKLGWTVQELDRALTAFVPVNRLPLTMANIGGALKSALVYLAHLKQLDARLPLGADSRSKLVTLWSNLSTAGKNAIYPKLFLTKSILKSDPIFDNPLGSYLSAPGLLLKDHLAAVQAALNLTDVEVKAILAAAKADFDAAPLSIPTLSLLYRHALLAKGLKLKLGDLIALEQLSGLNPFHALEADPITTIDKDYPFTETLRFLDIASLVKSSGFSIEDLGYLLEHQFDPVGKYREDDVAVLSLVRTLSAGLRQIAREQAPPADPNSLSDDVLQQKLALVFPPDAVSTLMGMWNGAIVREAVVDSVLPAAQLDVLPVKGTPALTAVYDAVRQQQHVTFRGFLPDTQAAALAAANPSPVLGSTLKNLLAQQQAFYEKYLSAFLTSALQQTLFTPLPTGLPDKAAEAAMTAKRHDFGNSFLPYLQQQLSRQFVTSTVAAALNADPSLTGALVSSAGLLEDPSQPGASLLDAFEAAQQAGTDAAFYASVDGAGASLADSIPESADTASKPAGTNSARFAGYLEVAQPGAYRFFTALDKKDATFALRVGTGPDPLVQGSAAADNSELSGFLELKTGTAYPFSLDAGNLSGGNARVLVQGEGLPKDKLGTLTLYPASVVNRVRRARILLSKALQLIATFAFTEREAEYLPANAADFDGFSFSKLPVTQTVTSPVPLFQQFLRLASYAALRRDLAGGGDDLIDLFANARRVYPATAVAADAEKAMLADLTGQLSKLSRRDLKTIQSAAGLFGMTVKSSVVGSDLHVVGMAFTQELGIGKLWAALQLAAQIGVPADALARWAVPQPDDKIARDLRDTVKALYREDNWRKIAQSINDKLRQKRRDALVAYVTFQNGFDSSDQLFEFFLVDPKMEPVVQTSRLRLAISAVQTFVQRCFLNLEPEVRPAALNAKHWEWMKRTSVWNANRQIWLYTEAFLDPAFRDDKTGLYSVFEGTLSQGDVSNDLAETAFFGYLTGLDELAKLEILTVYAEQNDADLTENALHVVGRTASLPHKYFYRRYQRRMWTPWQEIATQVEGDHLAAIVWRNRLQLFWLTFMDKPKQEKSGSTQKLDINNLQIAGAAPDKDINVQLNWAEYFQGEWTARGANGFGQPMTVRVENTFDSSGVFVHATKAIEDGVEVATIHVHFDRAVGFSFASPVFISTGLSPTAAVDFLRTFEGERRVGPSDRAFRVLSRNAPPEIVAGSPPQDPPYGWTSRDKSRYLGSLPLQVSFVEEIRSAGGSPTKITNTTKGLLNKQGAGAGFQFTLTTTGQPPDVGGAGLGSLVTPFFYEDNRNAFYIEPTLMEVTLEEWDDWAVRIPSRTPVYEDPSWWKKLNLVAAVPSYKPQPGGDPATRWDGTIDPDAKFQIQTQADWLTHEATALEIDGVLIGRSGGLGLTARATAENAITGVTHVIGKGGLAGGVVAFAAGGTQIGG